MGNHFKKEEEIESSDLGLYDSEDLVVDDTDATNIDFYNDKKTNKFITFLSTFCNKK